MGSRRSGLLLLAAAALVLAAWGIGEWKTAAQPGTASAIPGAQPQGQATPLRLQARERLALAKAQQRELLARGQAVLGTLEGVEAAIASWEEQMKGLLDSEAGRQLARRDDQVRKVLGLLEDKRCEPWEVGEARRRVQALLQPVQEALADPTSAVLPSVELAGHLQREGDWADEALRAAAERTAKLRVLLTFAALAEPGTKTLAQALREVRGQGR